MEPGPSCGVAGQAVQLLLQLRQMKAGGVTQQLLLWMW